MKKQPIQPMSDTKRIVLFFVALVAIGGLVSYFILGSTDTLPQQVLPEVGADGVQEVHMSIDGLDYKPSSITVRSGQKVRWVIDATHAEGCARTMYSKALGVNQLLNPSVNTIEFVPPRTGTIDFSCTMGMARGQFKVV